MNLTSLIRQHWAAFRALLVLTVILGIAYPVFIWLVAQIPGLKDQADGSIVDLNGRPVASSLIGQSFADSTGKPLPQYFQSRPSAAGAGYDPMASGASNLGPEDIIDAPGKPSLLTQVCERSNAAGELDGVDATRPFCTKSGVGAVLSVIGPRNSRGDVVTPIQVISINEPCDTTTRPFLDSYEGIPVSCAKPGQDYSTGKIVPIRGAAPADPAIPADAVTASGSGLDPDISVTYANLQIARVAKTRGISADQVQQLVADHTQGRDLGFFGEPRVNVVKLNIALDQKYPLKS